jgi:hypothetical protein
LYKVSGETPRYVEASRRVITSLCCPMFNPLTFTGPRLLIGFCRSNLQSRRFFRVPFPSIWKSRLTSGHRGSKKNFDWNINRKLV